MEFQVFSLNCWGIPYVSKDRKARFQAIASELSVRKYDVVCLQEVWSDEDFLLMKEKVKGVLPYSHYFYSGVLGSGVCIFSKHPIIETFFYKWMINGYVHKIHHADWFGGKGMGLCRIKFNNLLVNLYTGHLHAEYNRKKDEYFACRICQAYDAAQFVKVTSEGANVIILAGDMNTEKGDLAYRLLTEIPHLKDAFLQTDEFKIETTNLATTNSYTPASWIRTEIPGPRIDYILYKSGRNVSIKLLEYTQPFPSLVPGETFSYSDHEAISATLLINAQEDDNSAINLLDKKENMYQNAQEPSSNYLLLQEAVDAINGGIEDVKKHKVFYWMSTMLLLLVLILSLICITPQPYDILLHVCRIIVTLLMCYTFIMATLWNSMEFNSLWANKNAIEIQMNSLDHKS